MKKFLTVAAFTFVFALTCFAQKQAEVTVTLTYLRKTPDYSAEKLRTLQKGERVIFEKAREANGWTYVSIAEGSLKGWILTATIQAVKNTGNVPQTPNRTRQTNVQTPQKNAQTSNNAAQTKTRTPNSAAQTASVVSNQTASVNPSPTPATTPDSVENDNEVLKIDTEEVSLNVRVVNAGNRPVGNLKESAFKVYEDGVLQPVTSVSTTEVPIFNAFLIDNSRSLRAQLSKIIEAGKIIAAANKPQDEILVARFVGSDKIEVVQDFTPDKTMINNALDNLFVEGGQTAIIDAVYRTAEMVQKYQNSKKKEDIKLRTLVLVTDGDDRGSSYDERRLFELLRNSYVQIYAIGFTGDLSDTPDAETGVSRRQKARAFLTRLAQETGGKVYFPDSLDRLGEIAAEISSEFRTQYVVSYTPTNNKRDGSFRQIKVEVAEGAAGEKRIAITRTGRNAPSQ